KAFDDIFKLPDIAGPLVSLQAFDGSLGHLLLGNILLQAVLFEKVLDQKCNVACTFSQRRDMDGNHVQPVEKVLTEFAFSDRTLQILVGCGQNADVDFNRSRSANPLKFGLLKEAKKFDLELRAHLPDFI